MDLLRSISAPAFSPLVGDPFLSPAAGLSGDLALARVAGPGLAPSSASALPLLGNQVLMEFTLGRMMGMLARLLLNGGGNHALQNLAGGGASPSSLGGASAAGASTTGSSSNNGNATSGPIQATDTGKKLAEIARAEATNGDSSGGWCYRDVGRALAKIGINVSGASAYMAADQLAKNPKVQEVKVSQDQLKSLPAGAIVVWDKGNGHEHGHISIATGDGKEASDLMRNQITNYGTSFRVFMPR